MVNAISMPAGFAVIEEEELTYIDGGAETGIWRNWSFSNFIHGFTLALGSASITAGTNFILNGITAGLTLGGAFGAAGTAIAALTMGQHVLLGVCATAAVYTIWYEVTTIYRTLESLWYRIFPKQETVAEEEETAVNGLRLAIA